jgi:hypothetical protein
MQGGNSPKQHTPAPPLVRKKLARDFAAVQATIVQMPERSVTGRKIYREVRGGGKGLSKVVYLAGMPMDALPAPERPCEPVCLGSKIKRTHLT